MRQVEESKRRGERAKGKKAEGEAGDARAILITNDLPQSPYTRGRSC